MGHLSALMGALGGDGAPACATNSSEQDDHVEVIRTPPDRGSEIVRAPYMVNFESLVREYQYVRLR